MANRKVVGIDYYGYILYEDDTPAIYSHFIRKVIWEQDDKEFESSALPISAFTPSIFKLQFLSMDDGYSYYFEIPILLEAKLRDTKGRYNFWRERATFENISKYFTPIKLRESSVEIPMLKTETSNEYIERRCKITREKNKC